MPEHQPIHRSTNGSEYYRERVGSDKRLVKKQGNVLPVIGAVVATALALLIGSR